MSAWERGRLLTGVGLRRLRLHSSDRHRTELITARGSQVRTRLPAGGGSLERTRLCSGFPANREKYRELPRFPPDQAPDCLGRASIFNGLPKQFPKTANREGAARYQGI